VGARLLLLARCFAAGKRLVRRLAAAAAAALLPPRGRCGGAAAAEAARAATAAQRARVGERDCLSGALVGGPSAAAPAQERADREGSGKRQGRGPAE
jgi:hypothetical protein